MRDTAVTLRTTGRGWRVERTMTLTSLVSGSIAPQFMLRTTLVMICAVATISFLTLPLAYVAERFEYDALREINTPLVIHRSQRWYGQLLLSHVKLLEWGFRIGGVTVNLRMGMQVIAGLALTALATLSQQILARLKV